MPKEYKFYLKCLLVPLLCGARFFSLEKMSELPDFITGIIVVAEIIVMLWLIYSIIRDLREMQKGGNKADEDKVDEDKKEER